MPLSTIQNLPSHAKEIFENVMKRSKGKTNPRTRKPYTDQERGKMAWSAVKKKYKKEDEKWVKKSLEEYYNFNTDSFELKEIDGDFYAIGLISTSDLDLGNDVVTQECLQDKLKQIGDREISLKLGKEHEHILEDSRNLPLAKIVPEISKDNRIYRTQLTNEGLQGVIKLNKHHPGFETLKGSIEGGFIDALSIEYKPVDFKYDFRDNEKIRLLNRINLRGITFTGVPMNPHCSIIDSFIKSLAIEDKRGKNMAETKQEETQTEEKPKEHKCPAGEVWDKKKGKCVPKQSEEKKENPVEEIKPAEDTEEVKSLKVKLAEYEAKEKDAKLKEQVKEQVKEEVKNLKPEQKAITVEEDKKTVFSFKSAWNVTHGIEG